MEAVKEVKPTLQIVQREIHLDLTVQEPEVVDQLGKFPEGPERDRYALSALRVGIIALRQASGVLDSGTIREEGERLLASVRETLTAHSTQTLGTLSSTLQRYFDPADGDLPQRLERLVRKDGELESLLARHLDGDASTVARTLAQQVGEQSPLFKLLSPKQSDGLLAAITSVIEKSLQAQREHILKQFSLDDETSALSRMSLLMKSTKETVQASLTLDNEASPLYRLRRELMLVLENLSKGNASFQTEVRATLDSFKARKEEAARSTSHGVAFEDAVGAMLQREAQRLNDVYQETGRTTGAKPHCKVGDHVIILGPESAAPDARIVCEAKEDKSYDVATALKELRVARENREAQVGILIFSRATSPQGMEPLARFEQDILVVWDSEDATSDVFLKAAMTIARALVVRERRGKEQSKADFTAMDNAIRRIAASAEGLAEVTTWTATIKNSSEKILKRVERTRKDLDSQIDLLMEHIDGLRDTGKGGPA